MHSLQRVRVLYHTPVRQAWFGVSSRPGYLSVSRNQPKQQLGQHTARFSMAVQQHLMKYLHSMLCLHRCVLPAMFCMQPCGVRAPACAAAVRCGNVWVLISCYAVLLVDCILYNVRVFCEGIFRLRRSVSDLPWQAMFSNWSRQLI